MDRRKEIHNVRPIRVKSEDEGEGATIIAVEGEDKSTWRKHKDIFLQRLNQKFQNILNYHIRKDKKLRDQTKDTIEGVFTHIDELFKTKKLTNVKKQTEIAKALADLRKQEAETRKIDLESDLLELERNAQISQAAQKQISELMEVGALVPVEDENGDMVIAIANDPGETISKQLKLLKEEKERKD